MNIRQKKLVTYIILFLILIFFSATFFYKNLIGDYNKTSAVLKSGDNVEAMVHGYVDNEFGWEWFYTLLWHHGRDTWFVYYLDHKGSGFDHYVLSKENDDIIIILDGKLVGILNTKNSKFVHLENHFSRSGAGADAVWLQSEYFEHKQPIAILHDQGLDDFQKWQYYNNPYEK